RTGQRACWRRWWRGSRIVLRRFRGRGGRNACTGRTSLSLGCRSLLCLPSGASFPSPHAVAVLRSGFCCRFLRAWYRAMAALHSVQVGSLRFGGGDIRRSAGGFCSDDEPSLLADFSAFPLVGAAPDAVFL